MAKVRIRIRLKRKKDTGYSVGTSSPSTTGPSTSSYSGVGKTTSYSLPPLIPVQFWFVIGGIIALGVVLIIITSGSNTKEPVVQVPSQQPVVTSIVQTSKKTPLAPLSADQVTIPDYAVQMRYADSISGHPFMESLDVFARFTVQNTGSGQGGVSLEFTCTGKYYDRSIDETLDWHPMVVGTFRLGPAETKNLEGLPLNPIGFTIRGKYGSFESEPAGLNQRIGYAEYVDGGGSEAREPADQEFLWRSYSGKMNLEGIRCSLSLQSGDILEEIKDIVPVEVRQVPPKGMSVVDLNDEGAISFADLPVPTLAVIYDQSENGVYKWLTGIQGNLQIVSEPKNPKTAIVNTYCEPSWVKFSVQVILQNGLNIIDLSKSTLGVEDERRQTTSMPEQPVCNFYVTVIGHLDPATGDKDALNYDLGRKADQLILVDQ